MLNKIVYILAQIFWL